MKALGKALAFVMLLALVGAGTATAGKLITGGQIQNGTVTGADVMNGHAQGQGPDRRRQGVACGICRPGRPGGPRRPRGRGRPRRQGRRTRPLRRGQLGRPAAGGRSSNIDQTQVDHPAAGQYCFTFPSGDRPTSGAANGTGSDTIATLQISPTGAIAGCPAAANVQVRTYDPSVGNYQDNEFRLILSNN